MGWGYRIRAVFEGRLWQSLALFKDKGLGDEEDGWYLIRTRP